MMLFFAAAGGAPKEWDAKGVAINEVLSTIKESIEALAKPSTTIRALTEMEDQAIKLQRTMASGMVFESSNFREQLLKSYKNVLEIGGKFEDITKEVENFSKGMGKVVFLSNDLVSTMKDSKGNAMDVAGSMVFLSKALNIASGELGTMVSSFIRMEGSQSKSIETIQRLSKEAKMVGLDSGKVLKEIEGKLKSVDSYGFKNGVQGLADMVKQAQRLRTDVDAIGALTKAQDFWDPEKAIETAANLQMLGGAIGNLGNPFKLMDMGMNDVGQLQDEMTKMAANAFKINKATGEIEIDPLSRMRLKEQATAFGKSLDEFTKIGREAFKAQEVINKMNLTGFGEGMPQESKDLLSSLTEVKGGKLTLDIPGFKTDDLESAMTSQPAAIQSALEAYQKNASLSEQETAAKGLTLQESLNKDARIIRDTLLNSLSADKRNDIIEQYRQGVDITLDATKDLTSATLGAATEALNNNMAEFSNRKKRMDEKDKITEEERAIMVQDASITTSNLKITYNQSDDTAQFSTGYDTKSKDDAAFSTGNKVLSLEKGEMFSFLKEDEAVFAPNLLKNLDILKNSYLSMLSMRDTINSIPSNVSETKISEKKEERVEKIEASGDININVNVTSNGTLSDMLSKDSDFNEKMKRKILNIIDRKGNFMADKGITK
jgi:hypothetical protein